MTDDYDPWDKNLQRSCITILVIAVVWVAFIIWAGVQIVNWLVSK